MHPKPILTGNLERHTLKYDSPTGVESTCGLLIWTSSVDERMVSASVLFIEFNNNPGMSVTNAAHFLVEHTLNYLKLPLDKVDFWELYEIHPEVVDKIKLIQQKDNPQLYQPIWQQFPVSEFEQHLKQAHLDTPIASPNLLQTLSKIIITTS